jgi:hypothetical protein
MLASEVQFSGSEYSAPDGKHALAWLLWYRHEHACTREPIEQIALPVFRGQAAQYETVRSGASLARSETPFVARIDWFGVLLCAWLEIRVTPPRSRYGGPARFVLSREERLYVAQHYFDELTVRGEGGRPRVVRIPLLDWTFDPVGAFVFAARAEKSRVVLNTRDLNDRSYLVLPPLNVSRPWIQKAIHGWNTDFPVTALQSVVFSLDQDEQELIGNIYKELLPKDSIAAVAGIASRQEDKVCPNSLIAFPRFANLKQFDPAIAEELERLSPQLFSTDMFFQYVDSACLKRLDGRRMYDVLPLLAVLDNSIWAGDLLDGEGHTKSQVIRPIWRNPESRWAIMTETGRYQEI